jgi:hypothetical protein
MKTGRIAILVMVSLMAAHGAFAGQGSSSKTVAAPKSGKLGGATGAKKGGPSINGTTIRPKR